MCRRHLACLLTLAATASPAVPPAAAQTGPLIVQDVREGPFRDPFLRAAEAIVRQQGYRDEMSLLIAFSGPPDETIECRSGGRCPEGLHAAERLKALVGPLRGVVRRYSRSSADAETAWDSLQRELRAGRPVLAEELLGPGTLCLVTACDPARRTVTALSAGRRTEKPFTEWMAREWAFSSACLGSTTLPGPNPEQTAVTRLLARAQLSRASNGGEAPRPMHALGLQDFQSWSDHALAGTGRDAGARAQLIGSWVESRELLARFLRGAAGRQDPAIGQRLRAAADDIEKEEHTAFRALRAPPPSPATATTEGASGEPMDPGSGFSGGVPGNSMEALKAIAGQAGGGGGGPVGDQIGAALAVLKGGAAPSGGTNASSGSTATTGGAPASGGTPAAPPSEGPLSLPLLFGLIGLALVGAGLVAWRVTAPVRLAGALEEPPAPPPGIAPEAARMEELMAKPPTTGLLLTHVNSREQAYRQGLRPGDIVCRYAGETVETLEALRRLAVQPGSHNREVTARRDGKTVKTFVAAGPLGVNGVAVTRGKPFWRRLHSRPFTPDWSGFPETGELWYHFTQGGRAVGFECRRWLWRKSHLEVTCVAGFIGENEPTSVRAFQKLHVNGDQITCPNTRFTAKGGRRVDVNASVSGGRWVVMLDGKSVKRSIPEQALPSHALAVYGATLPYESGWSYDVVRVEEHDFEASYGCQITCLGQEVVQVGHEEQRAWRFELNDYGTRQASFWYSPQRQLVRAEYSGLVCTLCGREDALAGLPDAVRELAEVPYS